MKARIWPALAVCSYLAGGCDSARDAGSPPAVPVGWDRELALAPLADEDPAPDVVQVSLDARVARVQLGDGRSAEAWTYSGASPGPLIRGRVGDTLRVHFENHLPEATTVHWHGLEVPADQDGAGHAGSEIPAGGSFDFEFVLRHPGTFWYHPHVDSAAQVWRGLYGALIVEARDEPALGQELTLLLHDVELDAESGELAPAAAQGDLGRFFGHEGRTLLVNGRIQPAVAIYPGSALRMRIINASISRYYRLGVPGLRLWRVAGDSGLSARSEQVDDVLLVPGERTELVLVARAEPDAELTLRSLPYDRFMCGGDCAQAQDLMRFRVEAGGGHALSIPETLSTIEPIDLGGAVARELVLSESTRGGDTVLAINGHVFDGHGGGLILDARVGTTELWTVRNATDYDHPFHLHGFRFQVVERGGRDEASSEWKDTLNVAAQARVRLAVRFDDRPGMWMFHCHILDHAELGMMGTLHLH